VKGMLSPGSAVFDNATIEKLSVVAEGGQVSANSTAVGNPAFLVGEQVKPVSLSTSPHSWLILGILKLLWLAFELYLFFGITFLGQYSWISKLPPNWRYTPLLSWLLIIMWFSVISLLTSIILKWTLIGKRRPGPYNNTLWRNFVDWAADWHYDVSTSLLHYVFSNSHLWNVILMLHGMDVDLRSKIIAINYPPSKLDLIKIRHSFISTNLAYSVKENDKYHHTEIIGASIGHSCHLKPGVKVSNKIVPPQNTVCNSITEEMPNEKYLKDFIVWEILKREIASNVCYLILIAGIFAHLIPSFELWTRAFEVDSIWTAVVALPPVLVVQTLTYLCLVLIVQSIVLAGSLKSKTVWNNQLYEVYQSLIYPGQFWSVLSTVMHGTPVYNLLLKLLGVTFEGRALVFDTIMFEHKQITLTDKTLIDQSRIYCHYAVYDQITIGPSKVGGLIHPGVFVANALVTSEESGPVRSFVGTYEEIPKKLDLVSGTDGSSDEMIDNPLVEEFGVIDTRTEKVDDVHISSSEYADRSDWV
jgi:hypothetical protein